MYATDPSILPARLGKDEVRSTYERIAPLYDAWAMMTESRARRRCIEAAAIRDGEAVLEVAVGTGLTFAEILRANPSGRNEGIDLTAGMLRRAADRARKLAAGRYHLEVGDAYALGFPDASFDVLINNFMFDLLPEADFGKVLAEFRRVLRPNGRLVLVNMAKGDRLQHKVWDAIYRFRPSLMGGCRGVALASHVAQAGFADIERDLVSQCGFPSEIIRATKPSNGA
jgi:ubiquinone/menaquinone biosynthesis C-methylase UbiE